MKLYELNEQYAQALENVTIDQETGEMLGYEAVEEIKDNLETKIEQTALYVKNIKSFVKQIKEEIKSMQDRAKSLERKADYLTSILAQSLENLNNKKFETPKIKLSFRKSTQVEVDNDFIPWAMQNADELLKYNEPEANKTAIKEYLRVNKLDYARLVEKENLQIK